MAERESRQFFVKPWPSSRVTDRWRQSLSAESWRGRYRQKDILAYPIEEFTYSVSKVDWFRLSSLSFEFKPRREGPALVFDHELDQEIKRACEAILSLEDNWDGEGSSAYSQVTWERAINFLRVHVNAMFEESGRVIIPKILPGPDGSIDLHWHTEDLELLVNVPLNDGPVSFYGDDFSDGNTIKGTFNLKSVSKVLVQWLIEASG